MHGQCPPQPAPRADAGHTGLFVFVLGGLAEVVAKEDPIDEEDPVRLLQEGVVAEVDALPQAPRGCDPEQVGGIDEKDKGDPGRPGR